MLDRSPGQMRKLAPHNRQAQMELGLVMGLRFRRRFHLRRSWRRKPANQ